jgi:hypothetical protein
VRPLLDVGVHHDQHLHGDGLLQRHRRLGPRPGSWTGRDAAADPVPWSRLWAHRARGERPATWGSRLLGRRRTARRALGPDRKIVGRSAVVGGPGGPIGPGRGVGALMVAESAERVCWVVLGGDGPDGCRDRL